MTKIKVDAHIEALQAKVWECYTSPEHIVHWNFASDDWCCPAAHVELIIGGKYHTRMAAKDDSFAFDFEAIIDEVRALEKMSYTMLDGRKAEILLNKIDQGTFISVEFDAENENPVEMQRVGWQAILNNFKKYVESN